MALAIALDSNRFSDFHIGEAESVRVIGIAVRIVIPFIVLAELRAGFRVGSRAEKNERLLLDFLRSPRVEVAYPDEVTTHRYTDLYAELRRKGTPLPVSDLWIAAIVLQHDLALFSRDRHFDAVPRLVRI